MNYSINIFDILNPNAVTAFEFAEAKSLVLKWNGSNDKLQPIIGTDLSFSMEVTKWQDGFFAHLNTYDERRYPVKIINEDNSTLIWHGHLLPDQYEEPYTNGAFFVNFVATCGLGTLTGQYLEDSYYDSEKTIIDYVSACIALTGVPLDIHITPAITNRINPLWKDQYLDGTKFTDGDKKDDAYDVLKKILADSLCCIFQCDGAWYIYGNNKKTVSKVNYQVYDYVGVYKDNQSVLKGVKNRTFLGIPVIRTHTPRKNVVARYPIEENQLDTALYVVKNDGYTLFNNNVELVNQLWQYSNADFTAKYNTADGKVFFAPLAPTYSAAHYIQLRKQLFVFAGVKVKWEVQITTSYAGTEAYRDTIEEMVLDGDWAKILRYDIFYTNPSTLAEVLLFSNQNGSDAADLRYQIPVTTDRKGALSIEMIAPATAFYNIRFYRPVGSITGIKTDKIHLDRVQATVLDVDKEIVFADVSKSFYSQDIDLELTMHDEIRDIPNMIRLSKLGEVGAVYDTLTFFSVSVLNLADEKMIRLSLAQLKTVLEHSKNITIDGDPLRIVRAVYNYLGSDEFYVVYDHVAFGRLVAPGENMVVQLRSFANLPTNIADWTAWADDVYQVSYKRYAAAAVDVIRNLYRKSHPLLYGTIQQFITPREFINFNYQGDKVWYPLDVEWRLDEAETVLVLSQNFYGEAVTENLPPSVNAGPDIFLTAGEFTTTLTATASDPDGTIVSIVWQWVDGTGTPPVISSPNNLITDISGLTGTSYTFMITVTDNVGLTASDTVIVARRADYTLVVTDIVNYFEEDEWKQENARWVQFTMNPTLEDDQTVRITITAVMVRETPADIAGLKPTNLFSVANPGPVVYHFNETGLNTAVFLHRQGITSQLNLLAKAFNSASDAIYPDNTDKVYAKVQADITAEIITGKPGVITNVPIQLIVEARK